VASINITFNLKANHESNDSEEAHLFNIPVTKNFKIPNLTQK